MALKLHFLNSINLKHEITLAWTKRKGISACNPGNQSSCFLGLMHCQEDVTWREIYGGRWRKTQNNCVGCLSIFASLLLQLKSWFKIIKNKKNIGLKSSNYYSPSHNFEAKGTKLRSNVHSPLSCFYLEALITIFI